MQLTSEQLSELTIQWQEGYEFSADIGVWDKTACPCKAHEVAASKK
jgi:hypothetical protein